MTKQILAQGAEATITRDKNKVIKHRAVKTYRHKEIDEKIRKSRTRKEANILKKAKELKISVPEILKQEEFSLEMEFIEGDRLSETLNSYTEKKQFTVLKKIGTEVAKLHMNDIIHGDLTTSNTILKKEEVYIIDFGLGFISKRIEDKAVDLHLIKQALEAKHFQNYEKLFEKFIESYSKNHKEAEQILERFKKVEARGRNKH
jgi:TP53 regulating kinase-like protein